MPNYIREGRMGPAKGYKTGAVVGTYPKPMLVFNTDKEGLSVVPGNHVELKDQAEVEKACAIPREAQPAISYINIMVDKPQMDHDYKPASTSGPMDKLVFCANKIVVKGCPWKTVVFDNITGLTDAILSHIQNSNTKAMDDARKWASMAGVKISQTVGVIQGLPCHTVFIMHTVTDKNDLTGEIREIPGIPSSLKDRIGVLFSQFFYATIEGGKPVVWTQPRLMVKGIGARWPAGLPVICGALFKDIYGGVTDLA